MKTNGLVYGIIKVGFIEFQIYNEKNNGISYRPDLPYIKKEFNKGVTAWISRFREISVVETILLRWEIGYEKIIVTGSANPFKTAGAVIALDNGEQTFIDTIGGVTFIFEEEYRTGKKAIQICKYYDLG